ncbi:hypothetical protein [Pseudarthrobacter sp. NKDBFgelt]|uniref:hypothetical protein n=1 Tax=Pseudarthrobacter sp. NKDBFgelt TaxID=3384443 RepID=UPI0038D3739C
MPYFLEYFTGVGAGCFAVEGSDFSAVLAKAAEALRGLECTRAEVLYSPGPIPVFGGGRVLAAYTRSDGWVILEAT